VDEFGPDEWVARCRALAGRQVCWIVRAGGTERRYQGRLPRVALWREPGEPHLVLPPGATDGVHVLSEMELRLTPTGAGFGLTRRRWHEEADLDAIPLGCEPIRMRLEVLE